MKVLLLSLVLFVGIVFSFPLPTFLNTEQADPSSLSINILKRDCIYISHHSNFCCLNNTFVTTFSTKDSCTDGIPLPVTRACQINSTDFSTCPACFIPTNSACDCSYLFSTTFSINPNSTTYNITGGLCPATVPSAIPCDPLANAACPSNLGSDHSKFNSTNGSKTSNQTIQCQFIKNYSKCDCKTGLMTLTYSFDDKQIDHFDMLGRQCSKNVPFPVFLYADDCSLCMNSNNNSIRYSINNSISNSVNNSSTNSTSNSSINLQSIFNEMFNNAVNGSVVASGNNSTVSTVFPLSSFTLMKLTSTPLSNSIILTNNTSSSNAVSTKSIDNSIPISTSNALASCNLTGDCPAN